MPKGSAITASAQLGAELAAGGGRGSLQSWSGVGAATRPPRPESQAWGRRRGRRRNAAARTKLGRANLAPLTRTGGLHRSREHEGTGRGRGTLGPRTHLPPSGAAPRPPLGAAHPPAC